MCGMKCVEGMNLSSFYGVSNLTVLKWLIHHGLLDVECNMFSCTGQCEPIAVGTSVGLKCSDCGEVSKGGLRGFWRNGRLGMVRMVAVIFAIVTGIAYKHLDKHLGVRLNKNTWTKYLKDLGLVVGEALERDRRTKKYFYAQADQVAFGNRDDRNRS